MKSSMAATAAVLRTSTSAVATSLQTTARSSDVLQQTITPPFGSIALSSRIQQLDTQTQSGSFASDRPSQKRMAGCARAVAITEGVSAAAEERGDEADGNGALDGTQFLRPHLLSLAPYTPIEPFEVRSGKECRLQGVPQVYSRRPRCREGFPAISGLECVDLPTWVYQGFGPCVLNIGGHESRVEHQSWAGVCFSG